LPREEILEQGRKCRGDERSRQEGGCAKPTTANQREKDRGHQCSPDGLDRATGEEEGGFSSLIDILEWAEEAVDRSVPRHRRTGCNGNCDPSEDQQRDINAYETPAANLTHEGVCDEAFVARVLLFHPWIVVTVSSQPTL